MQNWQKNRNFRKYKNADGTFGYSITVDGEKVEVSEKIYTVYAQTGYKMENMELGLKRDRVLKDANGKAVLDANGQATVLPEREVSLDKLVAEDWDFRTSAPSLEDTAIERFEAEALYNCLDLLNTDERALIDALFFDGLTEREYSVKSGIAQKTINDRKHRVLGKLKKLL